MKVKCTYSSIVDGSSSIVEGGLYDVLYDGAFTYLIDDEGDRLYFDLKTGRCSWFNAKLDEQYYTFEEVKDQPKHATSPEVLAQVFRKMADNVEKGLRPKEGIQLKINGVFEDLDNDSIYLDKLLEYRVKPETITLKNGIEVPKPLTLEECKHAHGNSIYLPSPRIKGYTHYAGATLYTEWHSNALFYLTKAEAIEASKALFGLEIKDV